MEHFYIPWQVNLFYDTQSKFQNNAVLPKKKREVHFIAFLNIFLVALLYFELSLIWTKFRSKLVRISEVLLYITAMRTWHPAFKRNDHSYPNCFSVT
jgi:hypothetical protein